MSAEPLQPDLFSQHAGRTASTESVTESGLLPVLTVSQLVRRIKGVLDAHLPPSMHVVGEISNLTRHSSGHLYLSLKDAGGEIRAVMWRSEAARLKFKPADGLEVIATGNVDLYEQRGQVQFQIRRLEPRGVGALELAFRQLRDKLQREGLFDPAHKKPLPAFPSLIAVVTSPTGAAIRDILRTLGRRYRPVRVLLYPVNVQGEGAAEQIAGAVRRLNRESARLGGVELIIVGRGGGSLEDLWAFNEEVLARAIFASRIPIISGVGHETDVTISDLVADVRAATPTAAAELATPSADELLESLHAAQQRLTGLIRSALSLGGGRLERIEASEWFRRPLDVLGGYDQRADELQARLARSWIERASMFRGRLHEHEVSLVQNRPAVLIARRSERLSRHECGLHAAVGRSLQAWDHRVTLTWRRLLAESPGRRIPIYRELLASSAGRALRAAGHRFSICEQRVDGLEKRLQAGSFDRVLHRGFSITRLARNRRIVRRASEAPVGEALVTQLSEGRIESIVSGEVQDEEREADVQAGQTHVQAGDGEA